MLLGGHAACGVGLERKIPEKVCGMWCWIVEKVCGMWCWLFSVLVNQVYVYLSLTICENSCKHNFDSSLKSDMYVKKSKN